MRFAWIVLLAPSLVAGQDTDDEIKKKQGEIVAFIKTAKSDREFRAVVVDLTKLGDRAFEINRYELSAKLYGDAEKVARLNLKDQSLALSLPESAKRAVEVGKEYAKAAKAVQRILDKEGTPEDYLASGRFLCFTKKAWDIGVADLAKGKDEVLQKIAEADLAGIDPVAIGDQWLAYGKREPAAKERSATWFAKAWAKAGGIEREKLRGKLRAALFRPGKAPSKTPAYPVSTQTKARVLYDETCSYSGVRSLILLPGDMKTTGGDHFPKFRPFGPGKYVLACRVMSDGTAKDWPIFLVKAKTPDGKETPMMGLNSTTDQPFWVLVEAKFEIPAGATGMFYGSAWHDAGTVWLDDLSIRSEDGTEFVEDGGWEKT